MQKKNTHKQLIFKKHICINTNIIYTSCILTFDIKYCTL